MLLVCKLISIVHNKGIKFLKPSERCVCDPVEAIIQYNNQRTTNSESVKRKNLMSLSYLRMPLIE